MNIPTNLDDTIDSRDIIARIAELEDQFEVEGIGEDDAHELRTLQVLADDAGGSPDWEYGETLIRDSYFKEYAQELADDIGLMDADFGVQWPFTCIDWDQAARELQYDYFSVDFDGVTYWIRS